MKTFSRKQFLSTTLLGSLAVLTQGMPVLKKTAKRKESFHVRLLRHATLVIELGGKKFLVDPMLSKKYTMEPIQNAGNDYRIPMVDLPITEDELTKLIQEVDAVIVTHLHRDHWDLAAQNTIPWNKLIICQPDDEHKIKEQGFMNVLAIENSWQLNDINFYRTGGQHGTGEIGKKLGPVSGFVIGHAGKKLYIAGDTIWCSDVKKAITVHKPDYIIVNGGGARYIEGDAITMTTDDILKLTGFTKTNISIVHLETINHCLQRRSDFNSLVSAHKLVNQVNIPDDGDWITI